MVNLPPWVRVTVYSLNALVLGLVTSFSSHQEWLDFFKKAPLPIFNAPAFLLLLPMALSFNLTLSIIAAIELWNKGPTIKNITNLLIELCKLAQTSISLSSLLTVFPFLTLASPILLVIAISAEAIFHGSNCLLHLWRLQQPSNIASRAENKILSIKYAISFAICTLVAIGIGVTLLSSIGSSLLLLIGLATACTALFGGIISVVYGYYADKRAREAALLSRLLADINEIEEHPEPVFTGQLVIKTPISVSIESKDDPIKSNVNTSFAMKLVNLFGFFQSRKNNGDSKKYESPSSLRNNAR